VRTVSRNKCLPGIFLWPKIMNTIFAKNTGMTVKYTPQGKRMGVTVLKALPMTTIGQRTQEKHGYQALQVKIQMTDYKTKIKEVRNAHEADFLVGDVVTATAISKGKGFAGGVKRHGFKGGPRTHGQSDRERAPGSIGQTTTPGRVLRGKRMAGRMGGVRVRVGGLTVLEVNPEKKEITIIGAVPGHRGSMVTLTKI